MANRKIGIAAVAKAAGVSTATVDRVLNGRGGVRPDKEERIIETARALGLDRALDLRPARTLRIGVLIQSPKNPFHAVLREGFDLAAQIYASLNIQLLVLHLDPLDHAASAARISALIGQRDGLIISSPEDPRIIEAVQRFAEKAPVVTVVTDLAESGRQLFVGPDDHRGGRAAGDLMGLFLRPSGGRVIMVAGMLNNAGQRARQAGFCALLAARHPAVQLSRVLETGENPETAGRMVEQALREDPQVSGIYHASAGALQIAEALRRLGRADMVFLTHELTPNRRQLLKDRRLSAVIDQKPMLEARTAVEMMARLLGRVAGSAESVTIEAQIFMPETV